MVQSVQRLTKYTQGREITVCAEHLDGPFVDVFDFPDILNRTETAMCLDTDHAFASGMDGTEQATFLREYGDRIVRVH
jgi:sugar phosphate isomerase/epimerase